MPPRTEEIIRADESYTIAEFRRRARIGDFKWREIRKQIPVRKLGRRHYVLGADWLEYLSRVS